MKRQEGFRMVFFISRATCGKVVNYDFIEKVHRGLGDKLSHSGKYSE